MKNYLEPHQCIWVWKWASESCLVSWEAGSAEMCNCVKFYYFLTLCPTILVCFNCRKWKIRFLSVENNYSLENVKSYFWVNLKKAFVYIKSSCSVLGWLDQSSLGFKINHVFDNFRQKKQIPLPDVNRSTFWDPADDGLSADIHYGLKAIGRFKPWTEPAQLFLFMNWPKTTFIELETEPVDLIFGILNWLDRN